MKASIEEIPEELWQAAWAREAVIRPLAASPHVGRAEIEGAASALGIRRAYVYRLLAAYRRRPQTSTLVPQHRGRPQNARVLDPKVEKVIEAVSMQNQDFAAAADHNVFILYADSEQVRDNLRRAVMIAADPSDFEAVGKRPEEGEYLPMRLGEPAEVD